MGLCCMGGGITKMAHSCGQLDRVDVDSRRGAVGLWNSDDIQSFFRFAIIKIDPGQFLFLLDVLLAINLGMSRKNGGPDRDLNRSVRSRMADCFLPTWRAWVKIKHGRILREG